MKISNEFKIGVMAVVAVAGLIIGFNWLKGSSLFQHSKKIYAIFDNVEGMEVSNQVLINGLSIGSVAAINEADKDLARGIIVTISLKKDVHIPKNSVGVINSGLISSASIVISKGDAPEFLADGDTLLTKQKSNLLSQVQASVNPVILKLGGTLQSLDSLIQAVGAMFDPRLKNNFSAIAANLAASTAQIQILLNAQTGALAQSLRNVNTFTANLAKNNDHITHTLENVEKTTSNLATAKIPETVESLQSTVNELKGVIGKMNSNNGSLGLLLNDKKLYQNLESTSRSLNILLDDVRVHPKRYVNISVFGRKDKSGPLMAPVDSVKPANK
ncbi:MlaD family protein [Flavitalea sp. BT771]|uniref:MlaD family protein n=1 Tax=Flavitalea sp. BT771 TaxID=3063329 RepID=UPI0026E14D14|nr:MlaD family protein [Flavitalea sp. BT771]MDO6430089.1 MlaD family protein [Flavitalea sp. BT771]MDV6219772.1 MlaD family protein [Flavitalea sp. BT771]